METSQSNVFINPSINKNTSSLKNPRENSNENNLTKANTVTIDKSNKNEEIDIEEEEIIPEEFNHLNKYVDNQPKKESNENCILNSDTSLSEIEAYNKLFEDKEISLSDFAKRVVQICNETNQEKRMKKLLSTEIKEKSETTVKSNNNKDNKENIIKHSIKRKILFKAIIQKNSNKKKKRQSSTRKYKFNISKNKLLNNCAKNTSKLIKHLFKLSETEIIYPKYINKKFLLLTTNDKIGFSYKSNETFFNRKIKDLIFESFPKNATEAYKKRKNKFLQSLLDKEKNDPKIKIKVLNKVFDLTFLDFLKAFLRDESKIIIKNNPYNNNETQVYFSSDEFSSNTPYIQTDFETYKDCFNEGYTQEQKNFYKEQMFKLINGELKGK